MSANIKTEVSKITKKQKIAIIGSGVSGLSAAWQLMKLGYAVEIFEEDSEIGGKLRKVIPDERLSRKILNAEIDRFKKSGAKIHLNTKITKQLFEKLNEQFDAVVVAVGAHSPVVIPFEGHERLIKGLDFLKAVNKGNKFNLGKKVVVIGAGNAAMDVVTEAYKLEGVEEVFAIDIQKPSAFEKEIKHVESLGAKILWPCFTEKVTEHGVELKDGTILPADSVIIAVGDRPRFDFLSEKYIDEKSKVLVDDYLRSEANEKVFVIGDANRCRLFTDAIADGRNTALNIHKIFENEALEKFEKKELIPSDKLKFTYYQSFEADDESEKNRCMSCGYCRDCSYCKDTCPNGAIERREKEDGSFEYVSIDEKCIGCGICAGICPCGIWSMVPNEG
jgi:NADPH-dependent glutamate synthase beta subunit-like oxidoreductase/Pyruvate/2-oxoacid:ferredoxin oxidoreductase delta subunit